MPGSAEKNWEIGHMVNTVISFIEIKYKNCDVTKIVHFVVHASIGM